MRRERLRGVETLLLCVLLAALVTDRSPGEIARALGALLHFIVQLALARVAP